MNIEPQTPRYNLNNTPDGLQVTLPLKRSWYAILFMMVWLCGWAFGEVMVVSQLAHPSEKTPGLFLLIWLTGWTIGGIYAIGTLLWQLGGRELLTVNYSTMAHRVEIFGLGRTRTYSGDTIRGLRATAPPADESGNYQHLKPPFFGPGIGQLAFDYGASTIRLGAGLEEAEAKMLVKVLAERLPAAAQAS
jgi:hypothetical protein